MTATFPRTMGYGLGGSSLGRGAWGLDPYDHQLRDQTMTSAPTFPPFKFEARRARIDWRLLHGIDISAMMRDVDLDTLEKIVNIVAFGDIEAEDTRHLTELNFIKIFRLSQMMIEYLLYVQDCLQSSNGWLQQDRNNLDKYVQAARLRIRELEANLKMNKREMRRARKTIKTYELLAVLNDGKTAKATATMPAAAATAAPPSPPPPPPPPPQAPKAEINPVNVAMEALLRKELVMLAERLSKATVECQALRAERDDLYQAVKDLEASVKARAHLSGGSSPQGYARQNQEAMQTVQGLQDQLNRATAETTKLRTENDELAEDLERTTSENRQLLDEKSRLLSELASRPVDTRPASDSRPANDNLGSMLLDAERQKAEVKDQLEEARAEIAELQKQLMRAMKSLGESTGSPNQGPDERVRELELAKAQLEKELADMKRNYDENIQQLHEELEMTQVKAVEADRRLAELRASVAAAPSGPIERSSTQRSGGLIKLVEERRGDDLDDARAASQRALLAEHEAMNERLNQQLAQLKGERNTLAEEVEQLRSQLQTRASPARPSPAAGDQSIGRDWRTEEIERLKGECDAAQRRVASLDEALRDRDALVERLRATIRDLQAQLEERKRQQHEADAAHGRVKQQVQQFERLAGPSSHHVKTSSFSFVPDEAEPSSGAPLETPTSVRKPPNPELPPRSPSPSPSPRAEAAVEPPPPASAPSSPQRNEQLQLVPYTGDSKWELAVGNSKWLQRIPRPAPAEAYNIQQHVSRRVAGLKPEALDMMLAEEIRVITENPYMYDNDDEAVFRAMLPYEMTERPGVLSVKRHELKDLETARSLLTDQLLAVADDEMAQYGLDPSAEVLSDKLYAASMQELYNRRSKLLQRYPRELQERAERLRDALLTHLELVKRGADEQQTREKKERLQEEQRKAAGFSGPVITEIQPDSAVDDGSSSGRGAAIAGAAAVTTVPAATAALTATSRTQSSDAMSPAESPTAASAGAAAQMPQQPPSIPSRQASLPRSVGTSSDGAADDLRSMLPAPGMPPAGAGPRPASGSIQHERSRTSAPGQEVGGPSGSTRISPAASPLDRSLQYGASMSDRPTADGNANTSIPTSLNSSIRTAPGQQSLPRSAASSRPLPQASASHTPTPQQLSRETSQTSQHVVLGHAPPAPAVRAVTPAAATAPTPGGNMNMSIRSVKYQDSDFDSDDDVAALPQPKPVTRVVEDEYALTESEEAQQDMGIESSDDDFGPVSAQPKILSRGGTSSPPPPSRFGAVAPTAPTQTRGWATDEPLQPAPAPPTAHQQSSGPVELEELETIESFNNTLSQSLPRRPGAWGSPSSTMRKPGFVQNTREPSNQLSGTTIKSFGATSVSRDEVQGIQEFTGLDSFTENVRPIGRMVAPPRPAVGAFQAGGGAPSRTVARRPSVSSDVSDCEYI